MQLVYTDADDYKGGNVYMAKNSEQNSKRVSTSHQTIMEEATSIANFLLKHTGIDKVICAQIVGRKCKGKQNTIEIATQDTGLQLTFFGTTGHQIFYLHTKQAEMVTSDLQKNFIN